MGIVAICAGTIERFSRYRSFNHNQQDIEYMKTQSIIKDLTSHSDHTIANEFNELVADIESMMKHAGSKTGTELDHAKAELSARIHSAKKSVEAFGGKIADESRHAAKATNNYVHEYPWQSIAVAAVAGLAIGAVVARRK